MNKPELCSDCATGQPRCFCAHWPVTCRDKLIMYLQGFADAKAEAFQQGFDAALVEATASDPDLMDTIPCPAEGP